MSRNVDPNNLSADDVEYIRQRPLLRREFQAQGFGDPLDPDYPGLASSDDEDDTEETDEEREAREAAEAEEAKEAAEQAEQDLKDGNVPEPLPENKQWNEDMTKAQLRDVIVARNEDYEDDEKIAMPEDKKDALIAALKQDDEELAEGSEE